MNLYAYVGNDPLNYTDPTGMVKVNLDVGVQFVAIKGGRIGGGVSIDFKTGEISVRGTAGVRSGFSGALEGSITFSQSENLGNSASASVSANADAGWVIGSSEVNLAGGEASTDGGLKNTSGGMETSRGVDFEDSRGGRGLVVKPNLGVSAGVDATGQATLSLPDTGRAIGERVNQAMEKFMNTCSKKPC